MNVYIIGHFFSGVTHSCTVKAMRISRIYLPLLPEQVTQSVCIEHEKAHYIKNVLRLKVGHLLHFFIPAGIEYQATITAINKHQITLKDIKPLSEQTAPSKLNTTLVQAISSSDRMDYSIQKAAELGCVKVIPVLTDFCSQKIAAHKKDKKLQHWQAVSISACEQSGRVDIMQIMPILQLEQALENIPQALYLEPGAGKHLNCIPESYQQHQTVIIGPEGGFSPTEIENFESRSYLGIQLGQRVLRTETVAPVIMGALHALYGDFKP